MHCVGDVIEGHQGAEERLAGVVRVSYDDGLGEEIWDEAIRLGEVFGQGGKGDSFYVTIGEEEGIGEV